MPAKVMTMKDDLDFYDTFKQIFMSPDLIKLMDQLYAHNPAFPSACRLVRKFAGKYKKFNEHLDGALKNSKIDKSAGNVLLNKPLMYLDDKDPTKIEVVVFPNIILGTNDNEILTRISPFLFGDSLQRTAEMLVANKAHLNTYQKAWAKIKKTERLSIERALSRFTGVGELPKADNLVRDMSTYIYEMYKPVELHYATTDAQLIEMYAHGGPHSCMSLPENWKHVGYNVDAVAGPNPPNFAFMTHKYGIHPTSFYLYLGAKGVYIKRGNTVLARSFLFPYGDKFRYGRVYSATPAHRAQFIEALNKEYLAINLAAEKGGHAASVYEFTIPYFGPHTVSKTKAFIPTPYLDNLTQGYMADEPKEHRVRFWFNVSKDKLPKEVAVVNAINQRGYMFPIECVNIKCASCKRRLNTDDPCFSTPEHILFCSVSCYTTAGYVRAYRDDASFIIVPRSNAIQDYNVGDASYTNYNAAVRNGCLPCLTEEQIIHYAKEHMPKNFEGLHISQVGSKYQYKNTEVFFRAIHNKYTTKFVNACTYIRASDRYVFDIDKYNAIEDEKPKEKISNNPFIKISYEE